MAKPDKFHQHEALHTAHVLISTWEDFVSQSHYAQANPDVMEACEAAGYAMVLAYQAIGAADIEDTTKKESN